MLSQPSEGLLGAALWLVEIYRNPSVICFQMFQIHFLLVEDLFHLFRIRVKLAILTSWSTSWSQGAVTPVISASRAAPDP